MELLPLHKKLCSLQSTLTALFEIHTCRALTVFSITASAVCRGLGWFFFWQSLSCPFHCTFTLTLPAAIIVAALSKYLGRAWRNQTSELCTRLLAIPLFLSAIIWVLWFPSVLSGVLYLFWAEQGAPLRLWSQPRWNGWHNGRPFFPPSTPRCISWYCLSSCCLSLLYSKLLHWEIPPVKDVLTVHCWQLSVCGFQS